jgi:MFS family permease
MPNSKKNTTSTDVNSDQYPHWERNLQILPCANLLTSMGFALSFPFLPYMVKSLGVTDHLETWVGNMMLMFYIISFICGPIWGGIADHYGRKIMILRAMLGMGICMSLIPLAPTPLWFAFLFSLVGLFNGATMSAQALIVANTPPNRINSALSVLQTATLIGQTMGPAVATTLVALVDKPHWLFWVSGVLLLTGGCLVIAFVKEIKQLAPGPWRPLWISSLRELLAIPRVGLLYFLCFVFAALGSGNTTILSVYVLQLLGTAQNEHGAVAFWIGMVAMSFAISSVVGLFIWKRFIDNLNPSKVLIFASAAAAITQIPLLFLHSPLQLVIARSAFGLSASIMLPCIIRLLKNCAPSGMDSRAISYATSFQFIAMGLAPFGAGLIGPALGLRTYFAFTAAMTALATMLWIRSIRKG